MEQDKSRVLAIKREYLEELIEELSRYREINKEVLNKLKRELAKKHNMKRYPKNSEILQLLPDHLKERLRESLKLKPVRTISGVAVVAVMTKPLPCPGRCIYCPGGIKSVTPTPQSYTGHEPAARRAAQLNYDPYLQVRHRIQQLEAIGHIPQKIEIIVMGGTFIAAPKAYRDYFIRGIYEGVLGKKYPEKNLEQLQELLEKSKHRIVGLTIETRPDYCFEKHVDEMLRYGATRIEIGVQTVYNDILEFVKRGHTVEDTIKAFRIAKDSAFKIVAHMMPNLPMSNPEKDLKALMELIENPDFRPDMLKIYPTAVIKGTELYEMWKKGEYKPYPEEKLIEVISQFKRRIPPWIRIQRIQRDIPLYKIDAGYHVGNLRQIVQKYMEARRWKCRCIRCREVGHVKNKKGLTPSLENIKLITRKYEASQGEEIFISYEDIKKDILIGFLRLRKPTEKAHRPEIDQNTMLIRELHVYGELAPLHQKAPQTWQHKGYGTKLLQAAEQISTEEYDATKILVISGIGVREYYEKHGYKKDGPYMSKKL
ncbi:MAG: tRNA uridine(34) 5-carboxymethylaminomethyl modification radical SAM/GNAT enzyme Elp3 [Candidatus Njordarchaeia archaeon]